MGFTTRHPGTRRERVGPFCPAGGWTADVLGDPWAGGPSTRQGAHVERNLPQRAEGLLCTKRRLHGQTGHEAQLCQQAPLAGDRGFAPLSST